MSRAINKQKGLRQMNIQSMNIMCSNLIVDKHGLICALTRESCNPVLCKEAHLVALNPTNYIVRKAG